jgi:hypothetical protein
MGKEDLEEHRVLEASQHGARKKRCIARWRTTSSLFARTGRVPGSEPRAKV